MLGLERNSDVCVMGSFAPIFTHESDPTWAYDMIHFNSGSNFVTPSYHVQKMMGHNLGYQNLLWKESGNSITASGSHQVGLATWDTQASFDDVKVTIGDETIISDDFSANNGWTTFGGSWSVSGGVKKAAETVADAAKETAKSIKEEMDKAWDALSADDPEGCPVGQENEDTPAEDETSAEDAAEKQEDEIPTIRVNPDDSEEA